MVRCTLPVLLLGTLIFLGCGKSEVAETTPQAGQRTAGVPSAVTEPSPTDVVSQFLDQVRRGGESAGADELLTDKARSELKRIGRPIEPLGSPDARYQVTRSQNVPGEEGSALVHSIWSDPQEDGTTSDFQVVWAVEREADGWRISGMAIQEDEDQPPIIIDFENGDLMAEVLGPVDNGKTDTQAASQATLPPAGISR